MNMNLSAPLQIAHVELKKNRNTYLAVEKRVRRLKDKWNFCGDKIGCFNYAVGEAEVHGCIRKCEGLASGNQAGAAGDNLENEAVQIISLDDFYESRY